MRDLEQVWVLPHMIWTGEYSPVAGGLLGKVDMFFSPVSAGSNLADS